MIYVVPEILRHSVEQAQIDDLVLHHFQLQLAEDNLRSVWSSGTATPAEEVKWQEQFLDQMLRRAEAEFRMLKPLLQSGRTALVSVKTTSNPASDAKLPASKSRPPLGGGVGLRGGVVVIMCRCSIYSDYGYDTDIYSRNSRWSTSFQLSSLMRSAQQKSTVSFSTTPNSCWWRKTSDGSLRPRPLPKKSLHKSNFSIEDWRGLRLRFGY